MGEEAEPSCGPCLTLEVMGITVCGEKIHRFPKGFVTPEVL